MTTILIVPRAPPTRAAVRAAWVACCVFACLPVCNLYFDYGQPLNLHLMRAVCPVCAASGQAGMDFYNRGLSAAERHRIDTDPGYGNAASAWGSASARMSAHAS